MYGPPGGDISWYVPSTANPFMEPPEQNSHVQPAAFPPGHFHPIPGMSMSQQPDYIGMETPNPYASVPVHSHAQFPHQMQHGHPVPQMPGHHHASRQYSLSIQHDDDISSSADSSPLPTYSHVQQHNPPPSHDHGRRRLKSHHRQLPPASAPHPKHEPTHVSEISSGTVSPAAPPPQRNAAPAAPASEPPARDGSANVPPTTAPPPNPQYAHALQEAAPNSHPPPPPPPPAQHVDSRQVSAPTQIAATVSTAISLPGSHLNPGSAAPAPHLTPAPVNPGMVPGHHPNQLHGQVPGQIPGQVPGFQLGPYAPYQQPGAHTPGHPDASLATAAGVSGPNGVNVPAMHPLHHHHPYQPMPPHVLSPAPTTQSPGPANFAPQHVPTTSGPPFNHPTPESLQMVSYNPMGGAYGHYPYPQYGLMYQQQDPQMASNSMALAQREPPARPSPPVESTALVKKPPSPPPSDLLLQDPRFLKLEELITKQNELKMKKIEDAKKQHEEALRKAKNDKYEEIKKLVGDSLSKAEAREALMKQQYEEFQAAKAAQAAKEAAAKAAAEKEAELAAVAAAARQEAEAAANAKAKQAAEAYEKALAASRQAEEAAAAAAKKAADDNAAFAKKAEQELAEAKAKAAEETLAAAKAEADAAAAAALKEHNDALAAAKEAEDAAKKAHEAATKAREEEAERAKQAQEEAAKAKKTADEEIARLQPKPVDDPIKLTDTHGRKFTIPWHHCKTWDSVHALICQAYPPSDSQSTAVSAGQYNLAGPDNEIFLPAAWESLVRPGMNITMELWPSEKPAKPEPEPAPPAAPAEAPAPAPPPPPPPPGLVLPPAPPGQVYEPQITKKIIVRAPKGITLTPEEILRIKRMAGPQKPKKQEIPGLIQWLAGRGNLKGAKKPGYSYRHADSGSSSDSGRDAMIEQIVQARGGEVFYDVK